MRPRQIVIAAILAFSAWGPAASATDYFVSPTGGNVAPFTSWATAATNIQDAIDAASAGDVVWVTNGVYTSGGKVMAGDLTNRVVLDKPLTVQSVNGPFTTTIQGVWDPATTNGLLAVRCAWLTNGAVLIGFTLQGGATRNAGDQVALQSGGGLWGSSSNALVQNCQIRGNSAAFSGGGAYQAGLFDCALTGNCVPGTQSATIGGGACGCNLTNCTVSGNFAGFGGGGIARGYSKNCAITRNATLGSGGGAYFNSMVNCTVTGNSVGGSTIAANGGGAYNANLTNCIVWANLAFYISANSTVTNNYYGGTFSYCCTTPLPAGAGNFSADPQLLGDGVHLASASLCRGSGLSSVASLTDIDGQPWASPPAVGCDEWRQDPAVAGPPQLGLNGTPPMLSLWSLAVGQGPFTYWWQKDGNWLEEGSKYTSTHTTNLTLNNFGPFDAGTYQFVASNAFGIATGAVALVVVHCVDATSVAPTFPYAGWNTAATTIQDAIETAAFGDFVLVTNGIYSNGGRIMAGDLPNRVALNKPITVSSVNGPALTVIQGAPDPALTNGPSAVRCAWLSQGATLLGFTLQGGATRNSGDVVALQSGGGVWGNSTNALVLNCVIRGNSAASYGGGAYDVGLLRCALTGNTVSGTLLSVSGGGAERCSLTNCTISGNFSAVNAGGTDLSYLKNCSVTKNTALQNGGGVTGGTLVNCTIAWNTAGGSTSPSQAGGVYSAKLTNCIVYGNQCLQSGSTSSNYNAAAITFSYCCAAPLPTGTGNISTDPQVLSDGIHIAAGSPCIGAGLTTVASGTDIDGQSWASPPSIGCDEWLPAPSVFGSPQLGLSGIPTALNLCSLAAGQGPFAYRWLKDDALLEDGAKYASSHTTNLIVNSFGPGDAGAYQLIASNAFGMATSAVALVVVHCVDATGVAAAPPYSDWSAAATTIQDAVDAAGTGDFVLVTNGIYANGGRVMAGDLTNRVALNKALTATSVNGAASTFILGAHDPGSTNGPLAVRCAWLSLGATLRGFTLQGGATRNSGDVFALQSGGGAWCSSTNELLLACTLSNNTAAYYGGGCYQGQLQRCTLRGNGASQGGGTYSGLLASCLVNSNSASQRGGGVCSSTLVNCSVTANVAPFGTGGGEAGSRGWNSIVFYNVAPGTYQLGFNDWDPSSKSSLFSSWTSSGSFVSTTPSPQFVVDGIHLAATSPCRGAGNPLYASGTDFDGEPWLNPPSIGCDEFYETDFRGPLSPGTILAYNVYTYGPPITGAINFVSTRVTGNADRVLWSFGDGVTLSNVFTFATTHAWTNPGDYAVTFTAYNADNPGGVSTNALVHVSLPNPPLVSRPSFTGTNFTLTFTTQGGVTYIVEQTANLVSPITWRQVTSVFATSDSTATASDPNATNIAGFYRVHIQ